MVQKNQKLVVEIVDLSSEGAGVAKVEGYPIFVKRYACRRKSRNFGFKGK